MPLLPRRLGLFSAVAILIGTTIGSGIFRSPAGIAQKIPDTTLFFAAWIVGGLCVLAGALTYAELAGALPHTGGTYVYLREAYGELPAFLFGWANLTIIRAAALGAIATVFAEYMLRMFGVTDVDAVHYAAALTIAVVATVNVFGIKGAAAVQNFTTAAKYSALVVLVLASFLLGGGSATSSSDIGSASTGTTSIGLFGLALISILWVYDGWADVTSVSGEVRNPGRFLPLSLIIGTLAVIAVYLAANAAYIHILDIGEIAKSKLVAADVAERLVGSAGVTFVSLTVMVSTLGTVNGSMMTGSRIFFAMSDDGLFFKRIAAVHPRLKSPHIAITLTAILGVVFVLLRNFEQLADAFVLASWPFYAAGTVAVYVLRKKRPELERPYRVWGYPFTPAIFLGGALFLLGNALITDFANVWFVFAIILAGIPAFWIWRKGCSRIVVLCGCLGATIPASAQVEEQIFFATIAEQGGRSHASGDRPDLGPVQWSVMPRGDVPPIRVGITPTQFSENGSILQEYWTAAAHNHSVVEITSTGGMEVRDLAAGRLVFIGSNEVLTFMRTSNGAAIAVSGRSGPMGSFTGPLLVHPADGALLIANSVRRINRLVPGAPLTPAPFRGDLEVLASTVDPARVRLVNIVRLDPDYVAGVVANESLPTFHVEALKAQAIAARGYAVANIGRFALRGFDIDDSTLSQVYRGQSSEISVALAAARETEGLVLTREGQIISTLYSSSMGGHTESNEYVFPSPAGTYPGTNADRALRAVHDSNNPVPENLSTDQGVQNFYSTIYPAGSEVHPTTGAVLTTLHRWTRSRTAAELLARLKEGFGVPASAETIDDIRTTLRGESGRMMQIVVSGDWGTTQISGWSDLRRFATLAGVTPGGTAANSAPNSPSSYVITYGGNGAVASVLFYGGGFGHNVGMSQYGSQGRALRGQSALEILSGYYSEAESTTIPLRLSGDVVEQGFYAPSGRATLVIDNAGLIGIYLKIHNARFFVALPHSGRTQVNLAGFLAPASSNTVVFYPISTWGGGAVARVRMDR